MKFYVKDGLKQQNRPIISQHCTPNKNHGVGSSDHSFFLLYKPDASRGQINAILFGGIRNLLYICSGFRIEGITSKTEPYYVFLDEIQEVDDFERIVNGLNNKPNVDVYITGSNSKFLSNVSGRRLISTMW